ncbi:sodium-dependent transporter [Ammoniphilus sp. CFH 90114]|uniref:sodium-dependent transporter n=1 Tax=Ammoniphilus sp. CFH 90114 TaxID=2493665 RepID=UPI00100DF915|nr:sodium-dependent transporter [Ammoniphilus sp. CFH 90114]RXT08081.1 sodium-dependent transporter [Ammoniphilus sp. CFH 90114]
MKNEQWGNRAGFILAAVGSAIGLGNIWRFPYVAYENGGGAFLIPYLFALLTAGIPILILEFGIGKRGGGSAPLSFRNLNQKWEWLGWWQVMISFVIITYYSVIIAWAMSYTKFSLNLAWGEDTKDFLFGNFLGLTDSVWEVGGLQTHIILPLVIVWAIVFFTLYKGIKSGIERISKIVMPLLILLFLIITFRGLSLEGATLGLNHFFTPDWSKVWNYKTWVAAYGQIFFSLSIAYAIMITYSSYLPKKSDVNNSAFITAFGNSGFELLAGITVFSVLGFMAVQSNVDISEVAAGGVGLAFVVFPKVINTLPAFNELFGFLFFGCLVLAGLTSSVSILEVIVAAIRDKFNLTRQRAVVWVTAVCFSVSLLYATGAGLYFLDIIDHFINSFGVLLSGLVELILLGWFYQLSKIREDGNMTSDFRIGTWWEIMVKYVTPAVLFFISIQNVIGAFKDPYEGYPTSALLILGAGCALAAILLGYVFSKLKWHNPQHTSKKEVA